MEKDTKIYDCLRGCEKEVDKTGQYTYTYNNRCCKLSVFNWLEDITRDELSLFFEVRFKNTRKLIYKNESGQNLKIGDIVVVEAQNGYDVGIITLAGAIMANQLNRERIDPKNYEFKKIYRKAKPADIEKWQEAISKEHRIMIRSRQIAADLQLNMKIGDVEFQGDCTKAIFYYIADERVDFRQLIKNFADEFRIRIEMKQIGARQEAGLIGGLGVCGQALCCSRYMSDFQSITTQAARCQDLSLNPQKLAGQCGKLKCCINYEASTYIDAQSKFPRVTEPLQLEDGEAYLMKTDILGGIMWFSYVPNSMANLRPLTANEVKEIIFLNKKGTKARSILEENTQKQSEFMSAVGEDSISRFDAQRKRKSLRRVNDKPERVERLDSAERLDRVETTDRADSSEKKDRLEFSARPERPERNNRNQRGSRPARGQSIGSGSNSVIGDRPPRDARDSRAPSDNRKEGGRNFTQRNNNGDNKG